MKGTVTSAVPISIGHTTSEVTINDNLTVTGTVSINGGDGAINLGVARASSIKMLDNSSTSFEIKEGNNVYTTFVRTDDDESITFKNILIIQLVLVLVQMIE